jgi:hypothetical protein
MGIDDKNLHGDLRKLEGMTFELTANAWMRLFRTG